MVTMTVIKEVRATTGYYIDKDGKKKNTYKTVGVLENGKYGEYIRLDASFNPAAIPRKEGSDSIILPLVDPRERKQSGNSNGYGNNTQAQPPEFVNLRWEMDSASAASNPADNSNLSDLPF